MGKARFSHLEEPLKSQGNGVAFYNYMADYTKPETLKAYNDYGMAFLQGAQANVYAANATNCF